MKTTISAYDMASQLHFEMVVIGEESDGIAALVNLLENLDYLIIGVEMVESDES